jgi:hypothetical protein
MDEQNNGRGGKEPGGPTGIDIYIHFDIATERVSVRSNPRTSAIAVLGILDSARAEIHARRRNPPQPRPVMPESTRQQ